MACFAGAFLGTVVGIAAALAGMVWLDARATERELARHRAGYLAARRTGGVVVTPPRRPGDIKVTAL